MGKPVTSVSERMRRLRERLRLVMMRPRFSVRSAWSPSAHPVEVCAHLTNRWSKPHNLFVAAPSAHDIKRRTPHALQTRVACLNAARGCGIGRRFPVVYEILAVRTGCAPAAALW